MAKTEDRKTKTTAQDTYDELLNIVDKYVLHKVNIGLIENKDHCDEIITAFIGSFDDTLISSQRDLQDQIFSFMFEVNDFSFINILEYHCKYILEKEKNENQKINPFKSLIKKQYKLLYALLDHMNEKKQWIKHNDYISFKSYRDMIFDIYTPLAYAFHRTTPRSEYWPIPIGYTSQDLVNGTLKLQDLVNGIQDEHNALKRDKKDKLLKYDIYCINVPICSIEQMYFGASYWKSYNHANKRCWRYYVINFDNPQNSKIYIAANVLQ